MTEELEIELSHARAAASLNQVVSSIATVKQATAKPAQIDNAMKLVSVNRSGPKPIIRGGRARRSGIFKEPVEGLVKVGPLGLEDDVCVDKKHHGGADQAVYVYDLLDYQWWSEELGRSLHPGCFGENLTFSQCPALLYLGDRYRVGEVLLEVTAPRIPCATLAARMDDPTFVKRFNRARRPGFYCRVLGSGQVEAGQSVERVATGTVELMEVYDLLTDRKASSERIRTALTAPLAERVRNDLEGRLD